jgi:AmmeMemoRadiSam system protein A
VPSRSAAGSPTIADPELGDEERRTLLRLARRALQTTLDERPEPAPEMAALPTALCRPGRAFVTLRLDDALRGCIGHLASGHPLADVVWRMTLLAATEDPRFPPVGREELPRLRIEISVLSEPERLGVADPACIVPGRDGVMVRRGRRQGVLLPQVATEEGWDAEALLAAVCRKAGLSDGAWRSPDCELYVFQADVFGE